MNPPRLLLAAFAALLVGCQTADVSAPAPQAAPKAAAPRTPTAIPIVPRSLSRFTVTVELIELVPPAAPGGDNPAPAPNS